MSFEVQLNDLSIRGIDKCSGEYHWDYIERFTVLNGCGDRRITTVCLIHTTTKKIFGGTTMQNPKDKANEFIACKEAFRRALLALVVYHNIPYQYLHIVQKRFWDAFLTSWKKEAEAWSEMPF